MDDRIFDDAAAIHQIVLCDDRVRIVKGAVAELLVIAQACGDLVGIHIPQWTMTVPSWGEQSLLNLPDGDGEDGPSWSRPEMPSFR